MVGRKAKRAEKAKTTKVQIPTLAKNPTPTKEGKGRVKQSHPPSAKKVSRRRAPRTSAVFTCPRG